MMILLEWGPAWGYFYETAKYLFIEDYPAEEASSWQEFEAEGIILNFVFGSWYLGDFL